jgi:hypothetical protein
VSFLLSLSRFVTVLVLLLLPYLLPTHTHTHTNKQWLTDTASGPDLLCIVLYRGGWNKYDRHYLQKLGQYHKTVLKPELVQLVAWTSEGSAAAQHLNDELGLTSNFGYDAVLGDETNALAKWLVEDEILPNLVTQTEGIPAEHASKYPNGMVLPGMVWYAHHGNIVFQWEKKLDDTHKHSSSNCGGGGWPDPNDLWEHQVLKRKHALDHGNAVMPAHGSQIKLCSTDADLLLSGCSIV